MNIDKQLEEMASTMLEASATADVEPVLEMEGKEVVLGENATKILNNILEQAYIPFLAEALYNAGYRKADEVASEIFEGIKANCVDSDGYFLYGAFMNFQLDTMKKYTEGEV